MTRLASFLTRLRQWLAGCAAVPIVAPPPRIEMQISLAAAWEATRTGRPAPTAEQVFARAKPMPGIVPAGIAMDEALPANIAGDWGTQSIYESLMHEGLRFEGYPYLAQLAQRAEYRMIAEKWAEHATRKWIKITGDDERVAKIVEELDRLEVRDRFKESAEQDALFGRSQIFLDFDDADDDAELRASLPVDPGKIGKRRPIRRLKNIEPMWSYPGPYNTSNPLHVGFYRPAVWYIYGKTVHESHLLTFVGREVPDMLKPAYAFGGLSMTQMAKPYVDNWLRTRQSVSDMVHSFSTMVLKTNTDGMLSGGDGANVFARADMFNATRDNRGLMLIDKNEEELENVAVPISGLDKLQAQAQEQLSSVSGIPLVILLGVTPSGLNASSDGEVRSFYAAVKAYQEKTFRPPLARLLDIVQLSLFGSIDQAIKFEFEDLWEMSERDRADIRKADAEADATYINAGVVDPEETRDRLRNDETSLYHGVDLSGPAPEPEVEDDGRAIIGEDEWRESDHPRDGNGRFSSGASYENAIRYHGSPSDLDGEIRPSANGYYGPGIYLTHSRSDAAQWGGGKGAKVHAFAVTGRFADDDDFEKALQSAKRNGFKRAEARAEAHRTLERAGFVGIEDGPVMVVFSAKSLHGTEVGEDAAIPFHARAGIGATIEAVSPPVACLISPRCRPTRRARPM